MAHQTKGSIFNIERFAVHDGPGIRVLIFFKGCPLRCKWCSNPESQRTRPEIMINNNRCIKTGECDLCQRACLHKAISYPEKGMVNLDRNRCDNCGDCGKICPAKAIEVMGREYSVADILKVVYQELSFFARSGGGITLSGGEPLLQPVFVSELLATCRQQGIDTALETCGYATWESLKLVMENLGTIYYDIKAMDPIIHLKYTGVDNRLILDNLRKLSEACKEPKIVVRTPVVPGVNDDEENIRSTAKLANGLTGVLRYELLPYHRLGEGKYHSLGLVYPMYGTKKPGFKKMAALKALADSVSVTIQQK